MCAIFVMNALNEVNRRVCNKSLKVFILLAFSVISVSDLLEEALFVQCFISSTAVVND